ncbi:MAG: DivIVA domain-containing protein [Defluviitaleaceae bacterium]|nr:DivIVA domain-containing protein [Defluviitaleaceae bacterium]
MPDKFNYVKKGYDPETVDDYVDSTEQILREYRERETLIKNAIINAQAHANEILQHAQKTADSIIHEAENSAKAAQATADGIINEAKRQAHSMQFDADRQLIDFTRSLSSQRRFLHRFMQDYNAFMGKYVKLIDGNDFAILNDKFDEMEESFRNFTTGRDLLE